MWRVGDGARIKIWGDKRLPNPTTYAVELPIKLLNGDATVMALIDDDTRWWNTSLVKDIFNEDKTERICSLPISPRTRKDQLIWIGTLKGGFSVKSAFHMGKNKFMHIQGKVRAPLCITRSGRVVEHQCREGGESISVEGL